MRAQAPAATPAPAVAPIEDFKLPQGFAISVFASDLPGARLMTVSPEGVLLVARRRTSEVVALPDQNKDGVAEPSVILSGLTNAHSVAFKDGYLYIATTPAVMRVRGPTASPLATPEISASCRLYAVAAHLAHPLASTGWTLYVSIGSSCNVCVEDDQRRTTIQVFGFDGSRMEPYAVGLRNAIGFDWDPQTGRMWATDTGQDGGGNEFPPDEINLIEAGRHYGYPFFVGRNQPNPVPELKDAPPAVTADAAVPPALALPAHVDRDRSAVLPGHAVSGGVPECVVPLAARRHHDSREGRLQSGPRRHEGRPARGLEDFVTGWVKDGVVLGRPAGLATGADGALYVSDDNKGFIYRITYGGK